jgi:hypothetical protein
MNIDPTNELGTREKRLAALVPQLLEANKQAALQLAEYEDLLRYFKDSDGAGSIAYLVTQLDELSLAVDRSLEAK